MLRRPISAVRRGIGQSARRHAWGCWRLIGTPGPPSCLAVDRVRQFGDGGRQSACRSILTLLATSIGALGRRRPRTGLLPAIPPAGRDGGQACTAVRLDAAGITLTDATGMLHWASGTNRRPGRGERPRGLRRWPLRRAFTTRPASGHERRLPRSDAEEGLGARSAWPSPTWSRGRPLSVPIDLGDGPIGTLDLYGQSAGVGSSEVSALRPTPGWWRAARHGGQGPHRRLAGRPIQVALASPGADSSRIERADGGQRLND